MAELDAGTESGAAPIADVRGTKISNDLMQLFTKFQSDFTLQHTVEHVRNYNDREGIENEEGSHSGTGLAKAKHSKVSIRITRNKIRTATAKLGDALFGQGRMPFDTTPQDQHPKHFYPF